MGRGKERGEVRVEKEIEKMVEELFRFLKTVSLCATKIRIGLAKFCATNIGILVAQSLKKLFF